MRILLLVLLYVGLIWSIITLAPFIAAVIVGAILYVQSPSSKSDDPNQSEEPMNKLHYTIYARPGCPWCDKAIQLLSDRGLSFEYVNIKENPEAHLSLLNNGLKTVPQIYEQGSGKIKHIGGYAQLSHYLTQQDVIEETVSKQEEDIIPPSDPEAEKRVVDKFPIPKECHYCDGSVELVNNSKIYNGVSYGDWPYVYVCTECGASVGTHKNTHLPLGTLADKHTRDARILAKDSFNPLWISMGLKRMEAYQWLADEMSIPLSECHIGLFDVSQCLQTVQLCEKFKRELNERSA